VGDGEMPQPSTTPDPRLEKTDVRQRELRRQHAKLAQGQLPKLDHTFTEVKDTDEKKPTGDADVV
jgi:hypothetical protein